jgi:hypothetical protein
MVSRLSRKERYGTIASAFRFIVASLAFACYPRGADVSAKCEYLAANMRPGRRPLAFRLLAAAFYQLTPRSLKFGVLQAQLSIVDFPP